jgi:hypothetical protein
MELKKINYRSAVFFGVFSLILYLIMGIVQLALVARVPEYAAVIGAASNVQLLVQAPIIGGVVAYIFAIVAILIYNTVARRYPVTWEVKK